MVKRWRPAALAMICAATHGMAQDSTTPDALTEVYQNWVLTCTRVEGVVTFVTPFGVALREPVRATINGASVVDASYLTCNPGAGCLARNAFTDLSVEAFSAAEDVQISIATMAG